jgi:DNA-binding response OmpR family regulator
MARILVVEDDQACSAVLVSALSQEGHEVRCATSPKEAVKSMQAYEPDLLIADWLLDDREVECDGVDFARRVHASWPDLQIIITSGMPRELIRREARDLPIYKIIEKPIELDDLLQHVRNTPVRARVP